MAGQKAGRGQGILRRAAKCLPPSHPAPVGAVAGPLNVGEGQPLIDNYMLCAPFYIKLPEKTAVGCMFDIWAQMEVHGGSNLSSCTLLRAQPRPSLTGC